MIFAKDMIMRSYLKSKYHAIKYLSAAINLDYALEMLETQSTDAFLAYVDNLKNRDTKAVKILMKDGRLQAIVNAISSQKTMKITAKVPKWRRTSKNTGTSSPKMITPIRFLFQLLESVQYSDCCPAFHRTNII